MNDGNGNILYIADCPKQTIHNGNEKTNQGKKKNKRIGVVLDEQTILVVNVKT